MLRTVAAIVMDGLAPFEFGVVCEVFGIDRTADGIPSFDFRVCGPEAGKPVTTSVGAAVVPAHGLDAALDVDLLAVPAVRVRDEYPPEILETIRTAHARGATILSVCSGAFVLGETGLLDGRRATTHWHYADMFTQRFPAIAIDPEVLFVDDGDIITSAGTAAGIDACLHLVRRELGGAVANTIARRMVVPPQRDGGQRQFITQPVPVTADDDPLADTLSWMSENLDSPHTVRELARRAHMSERTFARVFAAQTGTTPMQWLTNQRVHEARMLLEETSLDVEEVARRTGFGTSPLLRHHFRRSVGVTPVDYRATFRHAS